MQSVKLSIMKCLLPSRELILQVLTEQGVPLAMDKLYQLLEIAGDEQEIFNKRLNAMEREGQVMRNRKGVICLPDKIEAIVWRCTRAPRWVWFFSAR